MKIKEIEKLCNEATPGPWDGNLGEIIIDNKGEEICSVHDGSNYVQDAKFISASRELMPKLIEVAKAAKELIARCQCCDPEKLEKALEELEN